MKKSNLRSHILMLTMMVTSIIACKKEPIENKVIDLTDANIRITKVEQLYPLKTPPFADGGVYASEYILKNNDSVNINLFAGLPMPIEVRPPIIVSIESNDLYRVKFNGLRFFAGIGDFNSGLDKTHIFINNSKINRISDELYTLLGIERTNRYRHAEYDYINDKISRITTRIEYYFLTEPFPGDTIIDQLTVKDWSNNLIKKYDVFDNNEYFLDLKNPGSFPLFGVGVNRNLSVYLEYDENYNNIPKNLITKVNQLLSGVLRGTLDDYIHNWQVDFISESNTFMYPYLSKESRNYFRDLNTTTNKTVLGDWIWSFAYPSFNVLPEQDKIISSKRMVGKKMVDIVNGEPVYQAVDSTATFPYTHDPIAKTLEIAGLKIWYEVLD